MEEGEAELCTFLTRADQFGRECVVCISVKCMRIY